MTYGFGTVDSDSVNLGSNPSSPATKKRLSSSGFSPLSASQTRRTSGNGQRTVAAQRSAQSPNRGAERATHVYVIERHDGVVKVGVSKNPRGRRGQLAGASPDKLTLVHTIRPGRSVALHVEAAVKLALVAYRAKGEWFRVPAALAVMAVNTAYSGNLEDRACILADFEARRLEAEWTECNRLAAFLRRSRDQEEKARVAYRRDAAWKAYRSALEAMLIRWPQHIEALHPYEMFAITEGSR